MKQAKLFFYEGFVAELFSRSLTIIVQPLAKLSHDVDVWIQPPDFVARNFPYINGITSKQRQRFFSEPVYVAR